ncbi:MAG TPA: hypothetical protein PLY93_10515, partial [Turneriella sp.]|nr:hypothetical protein [Turneriella sp.]
MAKKLFFHRRHKLPPWAQIYSVWGVLAAVTLVLLFFTSIEQVAPTKTSVAPTSARAFSQTLFYDLREADSNESFDVLYTYAKQLASRGNFKLTQEKKADCAIVRLTRGSDDKHSLTAAVTGDKTQAAFHLLSFLEYASAHHSDAAFDASLIFTSARCSLEKAMLQIERETNAPLVELNIGSADTHYNRIGALRNLQARTFFESAFLSSERTLWANIMATTAADNEAVFQLPVKATWNKNPDAQVAENPLWHHPALAK